MLYLLGFIVSLVTLVIAARKANGTGGPFAGLIFVFLMWLVLIFGALSVVSAINASN